MNIKKIVTSTVVTGALTLAAFVPAFAADNVVVSPSNTQGWASTDQRGAGAVTYVDDPSSPLPTGALQLTTTDSNVDKVDYMHATSTTLASVTELSYATKQVSGPATADPSYQLPVDLNGDGTFDTTLVYEPYWNGTVVPGTWQTWDVDAGQFWSSKSFTDGACSVSAGAGGPPFYTLSDLQTACPNANVLGFGVNIGSYNPNYVVETDAVNFNGTTYNFELVQPGPVVNEPTSKDACKKDGYKNFTDSNGQQFKNQGQCVSYFNHL